MGQSSSSAALPLADPRVPYFALTFQTPDKLTLALADESIVELTQRAIRDSISCDDTSQNDSFVHFEGKTDMNAYEFKFRDIPFMRGCSDGVYLRSMRLCCLLLELYQEHGWQLVLASDLSRGKETTTWFFQKRLGSGAGTSNGYGGERKEVICVCITQGDTIQLVNAPASLRRLLARAVQQGYSESAIKHEKLSYDEEYIIQMIDQPWSSEDALARLRVRRLMLQTIRLFESEGGYRFYGTVNTKGAWDSIFFIDMNGEQEQEDLANRAYFAVSLNSGSCITVIDAPASNVTDAVLRAIVRYWPTKMQSQTELDEKGAHEFRLKGNPWYATGGDEATAARAFICGLLETLHTEGYDALTALDVARGFSDKAVFIFRSRRSALHAPKQKAAFLLQESSQPFWCISLHDESKLRLINTPQNIRLAVRHAIDQIWPWGIQKESNFFGDDCYMFKLGSGPWGAEDHQNLAALMSYILKVVNDQGARAVLSADVTGRYIANNQGGSHSLDVHSWFLTSEAHHMSSGTAKNKDGRRFALVAEKEEAEDELAPLRATGETSQRRERPLRKISAVEYTSYVVNADDNSAGEHPSESTPTEEDTIGPLKRFEKPLRRVERCLRKASTFD